MSDAHGINNTRYTETREKDKKKTMTKHENTQQKEVT